MTGRHRRTLERILDHPTPANIRWAEVEALMRTLGVDLTERSGSRVLLRARGVKAVVHRPHPGPEMSKGAVRSVAKFLSDIGVVP